MQPEGDGAVVDEFDLHVGAKAAAGDFGVQGVGAGDQVFVELAAQLGRGGGGEAGAVAAAGVGCEGELADDEQAAAHVLQAAVHLAGRVAEDAQFQCLEQQFFAGGGGVARLGADEHEQAVADASEQLPAGADLGARDALDECFHFWENRLLGCKGASIEAAGIGGNWGAYGIGCGKCVWAFFSENRCFAG